MVPDMQLRRPLRRLCLAALAGVACWCVAAAPASAQDNPFYSILRWPPSYKEPPDPRPWWEQYQVPGREVHRSFLQQEVPPAPGANYVWDGNQNAWLPAPTPGTPCSHYVASYDVRACRTQ